MTIKFIPILLFLLFAISSWASDTIYVNVSAHGLQNGNSWANAYSKVHDAILRAQPGDDIWIAKGQYYLAESRVAPRMSFPSDVRLFGNFDGNESSIDARNMQIVQTQFLRGGNISQDSLYHYGSGLYYCNTGKRTLLNGIMFSTGYQWLLDPGNQLTVLGCTDIECYGGAIQLHSKAVSDSTFLTVENCNFDSCLSAVGSAIYGLPQEGVWSLSIKQCLFYQNANAAVTIGGYTKPCLGKIQFSIDSTIFDNNGTLGISRQGVTDLSIGGFENLGSPENTILVTHSTFRNAKGNYPYYNNVIGCNTEGSFHFDHCFFENNTPTNGKRILHGGIAGAIGNYTISNCSFVNSAGDEGVISLYSCPATIKNCLFERNKRPSLPIPYFSGGIVSLGSDFFWSNSPLPANIENCTFINNSSGGAYALIEAIDANQTQPLDITVKNCLFHGNNTNGRPDTLLSLLKVRNLKFDHNLVPYADSIELKQNGVKLLGQSTIHLGTSNLYKETPLFTDTASYDYRLLSCSPGVNSGDNSVLSMSDTSDLQGNPRVLMGTIDIGAYESFALLDSVSIQPPNCFGGNNGVIHLNSSIDSFMLGYVWSTGAMSQSLQQLTAGQYTYQMIEGGICSATDTITLISPDSLVVNVSYTQATTAISQDGSITVNPSGGTSPYAYLWSNGSQSSTNTNLVTGTYIVTITDGNGCTKQYSLHLGISDTTIGNNPIRYAVFPNPTVSTIMITDISINEKPVNIAVFNSIGIAKNLVYSENNGVIRINTANLSSGLYIGVLEFSQNRKSIFKFAKIAE
jgi:SprB repeat/Secretion system C-terminal sorting domain